MTKGNSKNLPEKKFTTKGFISATVWKNTGRSKKTGETMTFRTVSLERRYTDKDGEWQSSNSFRLNDLPKVALVAQKAFEYLVMNGEEDRAATSEEEIGEVVM